MRRLESQSIVPIGLQDEMHEKTASPSYSKRKPLAQFDGYKSGILRTIDF
jgi:hypothetical protein